jgi:hypothetical protein
LVEEPTKRTVDAVERERRSQMELNFYIFRNGEDADFDEYLSVRYETLGRKYKILFGGGVSVSSVSPVEAHEIASRVSRWIAEANTRSVKGSTCVIMKDQLEQQLDAMESELFSKYKKKK